MKAETHPWEKIYAENKWPYDQPISGFQDIAKVFQDHECKTILDLGCGNGRNALAFENENLMVFGVDIALTGLQMTKVRYAAENQTARLLQCDFRAPLPFRKNSFDGLFSTQVIHHARLEQVRVAIQEARRVLKSGGIAFISVSGKLDEDEEFEEIEPNTYIPLAGNEKGLPHHIFTVEEVEREFGEFVLEDISVRANGHVIAIGAKNRQSGAYPQPHLPRRRCAPASVRPGEKCLANRVAGYHRRAGEHIVGRHLANKERNVNYEIKKQRLGLHINRVRLFLVVLDP